MAATVTIQAMLYVAAVLQVAAAGVALLLIPISGMRKSWIVVCIALGLQAYRRIDAINSHPTLVEAVTALAVSVLLLAGIIGIRSVFASLRRTRSLLDAEVDRGRAVPNRADTAIVILGTDARVREMNDAARRLTRTEGTGLVDANWFEGFVPEENRAKVRAMFDRLVSSGEGDDEYVQYEILDLEGGRHTVVWHRRLMRDAEGRTTGVRIAGIDLTDVTLVEKDIAFRSLLLDRTSDSVVVFRPDYTVVYANSTACSYRGVPREEMIGTDVRRFMLASDRDVVCTRIAALPPGDCLTFETETVDVEGVKHPLESHVCVVSLGDEVFLVDVARDISDRRKAEGAVRRLAFTDQLTGLSNRAHLADRATQSLARAQRSNDTLAFVFMDLDRIKSVNDTYGHAMGDELLRQVGFRLSGMFRDEDTVARVGGDEFIAFARVGGPEDARTLAQRLVELMATPFAIEDSKMAITASVGVSVYPDDGEDLEALVAKADAAMYAAKDEGRGTYHLYHTEDSLTARGPSQPEVA